MAIFGDGPSHDKDYVTKDDKIKRNKLRKLGYRVFVIRHDNLEDAIEMLRKASI